MLLRFLLFSLLLVHTENLVSQEYELLGLIGNKIVRIDETTGEVSHKIEIKNIPSNTVLRDLVYHESKKVFYTIANPTDQPYLAKISVSGEFQIQKQFETEPETFHSIEAISLHNDEIYFSASLNGGREQNDFYSESLLKVNKDNKTELLTEIETEKPFPDIDALHMFADRILIFDGAPPNQNFLEFYELKINGLTVSSNPTNIYSSNYIPIADFCLYKNQLFFVAEKSLYTYSNSIQKLVTINSDEINSESSFSGLTQFPACPFPSVNLEEQITVCNEESITLDVEFPNSTYLWSDGSTKSIKTVNESGTYEVEITNNCGSQSLATEVSFLDLPSIDLEKEILVCNEESITLDVEYPNSTYLWSDGSTNSTKTINENGVYEVVITNTCGSQSFATEVSFLDLPSIDLEKEILVCNEESIILDVEYPNSTYLWSDGSTNSTKTVNENGVYEVVITNACGSQSFATEVSFLNLPFVHLEKEILVCNDESITLDVESPNSTYLWSDGSTKSIKTINESGTYEVEITNDCGSQLFETVVSFESIPEEIDIRAEPSSCSSYTLSYKNSGKDIQYLWQGHKKDSVLTVNKTGWYTLEISNDCGSKTDSVFIKVKDLSEIVLPNIITPNGDQKNDKFVIDEKLQKAAISIYNRYGKLVYQNPRYLNDWDSGNLNSGNYFYKITLDCGDTFKGWVEVRK